MEFFVKSKVLMKNIEICHEESLLVNWFKYLVWLERCCEFNAANDAIFEQILKKCLAQFECDEELKQERRLTKIFARYILYQNNPVDYFESMYKNGHGTKVADLYVCWACCFAMEDNFDGAEKILEKAMQNYVGPRTFLLGVYEDLQLLANNKSKQVGEQNVKTFVRRALWKYFEINHHFDDYKLPKINPNVRLTEAFIPSDRIPSMLLPREPIARSYVNLYSRGILLPRDFVRRNEPQNEFNIPAYFDPPEEQDIDVCFVPNYDKIMCIPQKDRSYSPEELRAYKWYKKNNIRNFLTKEMNEFWENGSDKAFRHRDLLVSQNLPQNEIRFDRFTLEDEIRPTPFRFAFDMHKFCPKTGEEKSLEEILRDRRNQMKTDQNDNRLENDGVAAGPSEIQSLSTGTVSTADFKSPKTKMMKTPPLAEPETCTTQSSSLALKLNANSALLRTFQSSPSVMSDDSLLVFEQLEMEIDHQSRAAEPTTAIMETAPDPSSAFQFNIYQDRTEDLRKLSKPNENAKPRSENDENHVEMDVCNVSISTDRKCSIDSNAIDHVQNLTGLSVEMNSFERRIVNANKTVNFTLKYSPEPKQTNIENVECAETDENDVNDFDGVSIYIPQPEVVFNEKEHADWAEVTVFLQKGDVENNYVHEQVNLNETRQIIDTQLLDLMSLSPFDPQLHKALLDSVFFEEKLAAMDASNCTMVNIVEPLKPKMKLSIGIRTFSIQKMIAAGSFGRVFSGICDNLKTTHAFKQEKPPNLWEYYICLEIQKRIKNHRIKNGYMFIENALIGNNATVFVSKFSNYETLLNVCNCVKTSTGKNMDESIVMILMKQMISLIDELHKAKIIHGDLKPDNFLLMENLNFSYDKSPIVLQLIDFGQAIDMKLFPSNQVFYTKVKTANFICTEMLENKPWTYQTDLFCLAGTVYTMLCGKYMVVRKKSKKSEIYETQPIPRYFNRQFWNHVFDKLINIPNPKLVPDLMEVNRLIDREIYALGEAAIQKKIVEFNKAIGQMEK